MYTGFSSIIFYYRYSGLSYTGKLILNSDCIALEIKVSMNNANNLGYDDLISSYWLYEGKSLHWKTEVGKVRGIC